MSRRLNRVWLLLGCLITGEVWALGLGDIQLNSALNQPLRADIELISATPDELANLKISIASAETFARYGIDRPLFLSNVTFTVIPSGRTDGNVVRVDSAEPVTEPFLTFLVEAVWSRGRLLREYTLLLDPPTFATPPTTQAPQAVAAPTRAAPADSGRITRTPPSSPPAETQTTTARPRAQQAVPVEPSTQTSEPAPATRPAAQSQATSDDTPAGDLVVQRGDTLWGIASRNRQDSRLTINQTMLAIYDANPQAFAGNINMLSAGATLRIPSADAIFRINRGDALSEVQRQHAAWSGVPGVSISQPEPSLTLVPPDEDSVTSDSSSLYDSGDLQATPEPVESATDARIRDIEQLLADHQDALIVIQDNELTALRRELADLRGEEYIPEPVADDPDLAADDGIEDSDVFVDDSDDLVADDTIATDDVIQTDDAADTDTAVQPPAPRVVTTSTADEPGIVDSIIGVLTGIWGLIGAALLVVVGVLVWFARRAARGGDEDVTGVWEALDADEVDRDSFDSTERLRALAREEESAMVVVEQEVSEATAEDATKFKPVAAEAPTVDVAEVEPIAPFVSEDQLADTGTNKSLEDTFSSDTAINLDQSDPVAEADFHMAYGLYDQAADLINGALAIEPQRQDLLTKLCEIYFVWGNRDAFVDGATRLNNVLSGEEDSEWDKIVIMGQQIAADHELFADVTPGAATKAVDLSFEGGLEEASALDMDFASETGGSDSGIIDLGADETSAGRGEDDASSIDFVFDEPDTSASVTQEMPPVDHLDVAFEEPTVDASLDDSTAESPTLEMPASESTVETPTIEQPFESMDPTGELPSMGDDDATELDSLDATGEMPSIGPADATEIATLDDDDATSETAEIDLDDLGLDLDSLGDSGLADIDDSGIDILSDLDDTAESQTLKIDEDLAATGRNPILVDDDLAATGRNPELSDVEEALAATGEMPSINDLTGENAALSVEELSDTDVGIDTSLLDATGQTQVLPEDFTVDTGTGTSIERALADDEATMLSSMDEELDGTLSGDAETLLAPLDDDEAVDGDFDFAKTEALPKDAFIGDSAVDDTGILPEAAAGSTDMDLDLDDLTAALKVSAAGDTVNQMRDDATVEQPRPHVSSDLGPGGMDDSATAAIAPGDLSDDLNDARTMTEVGTKLDLARAYVDMGDPSGARSILEEVLDDGDEAQRQQAQQLLDSLPS